MLLYSLEARQQDASNEDLQRMFSWTDIKKNVYLDVCLNVGTANIRTCLYILVHSLVRVFIITVRNIFSLLYPNYVKIITLTLILLFKTTPTFANIWLANSQKWVWLIKLLSSIRVKYWDTIAPLHTFPRICTSSFYYRQPSLYRHWIQQQNLL